MRKTDLIFISILLTLIHFSPACHYYKLERDLEPDDAEFYSKVRYIITQKEKKAFLELPDSEKEDFREEFWEKRDPYPGTEENEFKETYLNRIEKANEMFIGEGRQGWATDRGRIFILYGLPDSRRTQSTYSLNNRCREVWYYGNYPVVFIDEFCIGQFELATFDLTPIHHLNLKYMGDSATHPSKAQHRKPDEEIIFDFGLRVKQITSVPKKIRGIIEINIPYANLWFKQENKTLLTSIDVSLEIAGINDQPLWNHEQSFEIETDEESLLEKKNKQYWIEIPFILEDKSSIHLLRKGEGRLKAKITNRTSGKTVKKVLKIKL